MPTIFCYTEPGEKVNPKQPCLQVPERVVCVSQFAAWQGSEQGEDAGWQG